MRKVLGPEHPDTATSLNNLAGLLAGPGRPCRRPGRSTSARWGSARRYSAPSIPRPQRASTTLPACFRPRATSPAARPLYERALGICEKVLGPEHPKTATTLNNLAVLLQAQGDLAGARPLLRARAGDLREGARPRASRYGAGQGQPCEIAASLSTRAGSLREAARHNPSLDQALRPSHCRRTRCARPAPRRPRRCARNMGSRTKPYDRSVSK